jgi:hypothetical protein
MKAYIRFCSVKATPKPSARLLIRSMVLVAAGLDHQRLEHDHGAQDGQEDAQAEGKVAGAGRAELAEAVVGGTPGKAACRRRRTSARTRSPLALDLHECRVSSGTDRSNAILGSRCQAPVWFPRKAARPVTGRWAMVDGQSVGRTRGRHASRLGVLRSTSSSVVTPSATFMAPARRSGRMPSFTAWRRSAGASSAGVHAVARGVGHHQQLVEAGAAAIAGMAAFQAAHRLVGPHAAGQSPGPRQLVQRCRASVVVALPCRRAQRACQALRQHADHGGRDQVAAARPGRPGA